MSSRDTLKHTVSVTEPIGASIGDEWYNPTTPILLYKRVVKNNIVMWSSIPLDASSAPISRAVPYSDSTGTSIIPNISTTDVCIFNSLAASGTLTINAPVGTPTDGQKFILRITSTAGLTLSFASIYRGSLDILLPTTTTGSSKEDYLGFMYNAIDSKWDLIAKSFGY